MELKSGTELQDGRYRIVRTLGRGGFGITYLAEQVMAERKVCIKEFFPEEYYNRDANGCSISLGSQGSAKIMETFKAKFIKEAKTIAKFDHSNIIHIHDVFEENGTAYYVMEYIDGESLSAVVKRSGALGEAAAVGYIRQVAEALGYIHEQRIMHLDVKPGNVMLRSRDDRAILIDFGLSKHYNAESGEATSSSPVGVSHGFAPMEQYKSGGVKVFSPATDIYSLGATLYYLVTGLVPPEAADVSDEGLPALPAHLSQGVRTAIERSMADKRKARPQSIAEFLVLLDDEPEVVAPVAEATIIDVEPKHDDEPTIIDVKPKQTTPQPKNEPKPQKGRKSKRGLWIMLAAFVVAAVASFVLLGGGSSEKEKVAPQQQFPPNNEIWYTSSDGSIVEPTAQGNDVFGAEIVSNTYKDGNGVIEFKGDVTTIGKDAFRYCESLTSVTIPNSVTTIGESAFYSCKSLTSVTIPDSVTTIGGEAFLGCKSLTSVTIPNSVETIGCRAFAFCSSIKEFNGKLASDDRRCLIINGKLVAFAPARITEYTIPNSVTTIGDYAFYDGNKLKSVTIPNSVTTIGECAFYSCTNLTSITIPNSVTTIGEWAFAYCNNLSGDTKIKIRKINPKAL